MLEHRDLTERIFWLLSLSKLASRPSTKGTQLPLGFRTGLLVADTGILKVKTVSAWLPAHQAR